MDAASLVWGTSCGYRFDSRIPGVLLSLIRFFLHKGVIWLFLATIAEVPPAVGLQSFFSPLPISSLCYAPGIRYVESKWYFFHHYSSQSIKSGLNSILLPPSDPLNLVCPESD